MAGESATKQAMRSRISSILMSDGCNAINFNYDGVYVDGSGFSYVALAMVQNSSHKSSVKIVFQHMRRFVEAFYQPSTNTFAFPREGYGTTPFEMMSIVHESMHCLFDAQKHKKTTTLTNEMCAFIASAFYNVAMGSPYEPETPGDVFSEAWNVALKLSQNRRETNYLGSYALDASDVADLRAAVLAHPAYANLKRNPRTYDGISGVRL